MARASRAGENRDKEWDRIAAIFDAELAKLGEPTVKNMGWLVDVLIAKMGKL